MPLGVSAMITANIHLHRDFNIKAHDKGGEWITVEDAEGNEVTFFVDLEMFVNRVDNAVLDLRRVGEPS